MKRSSWLLAMVGCLVLAAGCAKRVPSPDLTFESHQKVLLTFGAGDEIEGRIAPGKRVELRDASGVWSAMVADVTEEQIVLANLVKIRDLEGVALQAARVANTLFTIQPPETERTFSRSEIQRVDLVKMDIGETARQATFWTYGAVVISLLVGERS